MLSQQTDDNQRVRWRGTLLNSADWIFRLQPELKTIFSSTWRVSGGRRELCFVGTVNGSLSLRPLLDLEALPSGPTH